MFLFGIAGEAEAQSECVQGQTYSRGETCRVYVKGSDESTRSLFFRISSFANLATVGNVQLLSSFRDPLEVMGMHEGEEYCFRAVHRGGGNWEFVTYPNNAPGTNLIPSFSESVSNQIYTQNSPVSLTLPAATGGNGTLAYSVSPSLPAGLTRSGFVISGTPTAVQGATDYIWTAAETADTDMVSLTFTITVNADLMPLFSGTVPDRIYTQGNAITTLQLPMATGGNGALVYSVSPSLPTGLIFLSLTRRIMGTPTSAQAEVTYTLTARDADGDTDTLNFRITVEADSMPSFSDTVSAQVYTQGDAITALQLPMATGGNGALAYSVSPSLPAGLVFSSSTRRITGTPSSVQPSMTYTLTARDADGDTDTLNFRITVEANSIPLFNEPSVPNQIYTQNSPISLSLPAATGGDGTLGYSLSGNLPTGLTRRDFVISGTPTAMQVATDYIWTVADNADTDMVSLTFTITVNADLAPSFGDTVPERIYTRNSAITALQLPTAAGGNGALTYSVSTLPAGLNFSPSTRRITGTPTSAQAQMTHTLTARDEDGDTDTLDFVIAVFPT